MCAVSASETIGVGSPSPHPARYRRYRRSEDAVRRPWVKKPALVEWDLTGGATDGFGAVVFLTAAPARIVVEIEPKYRSSEDVASAVEQWLATAPDRYRLNTEFQEFKATARRLSGEERPVREAGEWWRALD